MVPFAGPVLFLTERRFCTGAVSTGRHVGDTRALLGGAMAAPEPMAAPRQVQIQHAGKLLHLGYFKDATLGAKAWDRCVSR